MHTTKIIFFGIFLMILGIVPGFPVFAAPQPAPAIPFDDNAAEQAGTFGKFEVGLPGLSKDTYIDDFVKEPTPILNFINLAVKAVIAVLVVIGLISVVVGGYIYMTAAGNGSRVGLAKEIISAALIGIFLSLVSVIILNTINKYIGSDAQEPQLGEPSSGTSTSGGGTGSGTGSGTGTGTSTGTTAGLPTSGTTTGGPTSGTQKFGSAIEPSTPETTTIIIDSKNNYYIRDSAGNDHLTTLDGAVKAAEATPYLGDDNLRVQIYKSKDATELPEIALREKLNNTELKFGHQIEWKDRPFDQPADR